MIPFKFSMCYIPSVACTPLVDREAAPNVIGRFGNPLSEKLIPTYLFLLTVCIFLLFSSLSLVFARNFVTSTYMSSRVQIVQHGVAKKEQYRQRCTRYEPPITRLHSTWCRCPFELSNRSRSTEIACNNRSRRARSLVTAVVFARPAFFFPWYRVKIVSN